MSNVLIEGYTIDEILGLPDKLIKAYIPDNTPVVFRVGTGEVLGEFSLREDRLTIELAQIDGGGEGVLISLWILANRYAAAHKIAHVEWIVHAVNCAKPNLKLRKMLDARGFIVRDVEGIGSVYYLLHELPAAQ